MAAFRATEGKSETIGAEGPVFPDVLGAGECRCGTSPNFVNKNHRCVFTDGRCIEEVADTIL